MRRSSIPCKPENQAILSVTEMKGEQSVFIVYAVILSVRILAQYKDALFNL